MRNWELSRRALLKDLGVGAACLPLFHAGRASAAPAEGKLLIVQATEGYRTSAWLPRDGSLMAAPLPPSSSPLERHKADLVFLHDMANRGFPCDACGHGAYGTIYYGLPPRPGTGEYAEPNGPTVDQVIARALGNSASGRPSFHAAVEIQLPPSLGGPGHNHCFWAGPNQPMNYELDPVATYANVFGGSGGPGQPVDDTAARRLLARRQSILDYVGDTLSQFALRLGAEDRMIAQQHAASVRQLETQLSAIVGQRASCGAAPMGPLDDGNMKMYEAVYDAYAALIVALLKCGVTRVATLQLADATGDSIDFGAFVPMIPATGTGYKTIYRNWHDLGHHPVMNGVDHKQIVDQWWMAKLARLIDELKAAPDPAGGSLFDHSVTLWGNHMHEGSDHGAQAIPWILAGSCNGYFKTGQCLGKNDTTMVLADICQAMGVTTHPFGSSFAGLRA
jgi:hypothetical protein